METDAAIVRRAIEGDERAMRMLWNQHSAHVDAIVRRLAGDPDLAEDIAQEVWIQIFRALPSWRGDAKFSTWVHRVAVNRTLNALRSTRRQSGCGSTAITVAPSRRQARTRLPTCAPMSNPSEPGPRNSP